MRHPAAQCPHSSHQHAVLGVRCTVSAATSEDGISSKALEDQTRMPWGKISALLRIFCG